MKTLRTIAAVAALFVAAGLTLPVAQAHEVNLGDIKRTNLLRNDLGAAGREVIQVLVEFGPGVSAVRHSHPGEELVYVTEGALEYQLDGRPPLTVKAGEVLFIPHGTPHAVKNIGSVKAAELATYIVEKGKPLLMLSE
ncbi:MULTISPECIES: cupin domain-containing protein [Bradyrhizobium]|uniref:cupin domain-containing protein n=1 Tax=Bradyrhizobium TaxID=374 RepID=UPI002303C95B|nr:MULTISPECIES: cupin domain-containing protein [Bradyrhizobium]MDA9547695.1 cupin [Bradyrhizobium sp. CCBAU 45321]MDF0496537.1 cupin domain-containing protein [Bradyrhizobium yuanmingense]MDF0584074.1 cupin domain-containing protein [Bradyrhizobium yuanmingense]